MTGRPERRFSRRGLFSVFGVGARTVRETIQRGSSNLAPGGASPTSAPRSGFDRKLRPPEETVDALLESPGAWGIDLRRRPLEVGRSWRATGEALAEPLLVVRVNASHVAVVGGECPVDGSDLLWLAFEDRVACPSCGSRWRLDGDVMRAPADSPLASFLAEERSGILRIRAN